MATKTSDLLSMVDSLPIDIKTKLIEKILNSLYPTQKEIDELWAEEAENRLKEIKNGNVKTISSKEVFKEVKRLYNK